MLYLDDYTKLYQTIPNVSKAVRIAEKITLLDQKLRKEYFRALSKSPKSSHNKLLKKAKSHMLQQKITILLTKGNARKLKSLSMKNDIEVTEMTEKIVFDYLKRS